MKYAQETTAILVEAPEKFVAHASEVGLLGTVFSLDHTVYKRAEEVGILRVYTARDQHDDLQGYAVYYVMDHPHYGTLQAVQDCLYLDPSCRGRFIGPVFLSWINDAMLAEGVQHVFQSVPCSADFGPMLQRLGFQPHETIYHKILGAKH